MSVRDTAGKIKRVAIEYEDGTERVITAATIGRVVIHHENGDIVVESGVGS